MANREFEDSPVASGWCFRSLGTEAAAAAGLAWESPQAGLEMFPGLAAHWMFTCRADDRSCHW